jgi:Marseillevirus putative peptidoglycan peptidase
MLFSSAVTTGEKLIRGTTRSIFSHVALVLRDQGKLYLWEADMGQGYRSGPRVIPLEVKLQRYKGEKVAALRHLREPKTYEQVQPTISKYISYTMDEVMLPWFLKYRSPASKQIFCSELVAKTLQELRILPLAKNACEFSPHDFYVWSSPHYCPSVFFRFGSSSSMMNSTHRSTTHTSTLELS